MRKFLLVVAVVLGLVCGGSVAWGNINTYYVPYFSNEKGVSCGIALTNHGEETNIVELEYYSHSGTRVDMEEIILPAYNQRAFVPSLQTSVTGWIKIKSPYPVWGLALVINGASMLDLDFKQALHKNFIVPQVAAGDSWTSTLMMCNPNDAGVIVTLTYTTPDASERLEQTVQMAATGSTAISLRETFNRSLNGGYLHVSSPKTIAAFMTYDGSVSGDNNWKAGLSAVPIIAPNDPNTVDPIPYAGTPPTPTGFRATSGYNLVILNWDNPRDIYRNHKHTEIWRSVDNEFTNASLLGTEQYMSRHTDYTKETFFYWARFISTGNTPGTYAGPLECHGGLPF